MLGRVKACMYIVFKDSLAKKTFNVIYVYDTLKKKFKVRLSVYNAHVEVPRKSRALKMMLFDCDYEIIIWMVLLNIGSYADCFVIADQSKNIYVLSFLRIQELHDQNTCIENSHIYISLCFI